MHNSNQTYSSGLYIGDPYIYTGNQCRNEFCLSNSLLSHVNIYNMLFPQINYSFFSELYGNIKEIRDVNFEKNHSYNEDTRKYSKKYVFNELRELVMFVKKSGSLEDKIELFPSLRKNKLRRFTRTSNSSISWTRNIYFTKDMQFEKFEENSFYKNNETSSIQAGRKNEKYGYRQGKVLQKTRFINNSKESSRAFIKFDEYSNILEVVANEQSDKSHLLYKSKYFYNKDRNIEKILFWKNKTDSFSKETETNYSFEYDSLGYLKGYKGKSFEHDSKGNLVSQIDGALDSKHFKKIFSFKYDQSGNWTQKIIKHFRNYYGHDEIIWESRIEREIEYH